jgi:hypothetical protein
MRSWASTWVTAVLLLAAGASNAAADVTVTISPTALLTAKVLLKVAVQVTCSAFDDPSVPNFSQDGFVTVEQASGQAITSAEGLILAPIVCDNTTHVYEVSMLAFPGGRPFHGGPAVVTGFVRACGILEGAEVCQEATAGPQLVNVRGGGNSH